MCHRLFNTSWAAEDEARRRAVEQQEKPRVQEHREEAPRKERVQAQEERRVESEVA